MVRYDVYQVSSLSSLSLIQRFFLRIRKAMDIDPQPDFDESRKPVLILDLQSPAADSSPLSSCPPTASEHEASNHNRGPESSSLTAPAPATPTAQTAPSWTPLRPNTDTSSTLLTHCQHPPAQGAIPIGPPLYNIPGIEDFMYPTHVNACARDPYRMHWSWPLLHPPLRRSYYSNRHPSKIPNSAFLDEEEQDTNPALTLRDPWESGNFDPSLTPVSL